MKIWEKKNKAIRILQIKSPHYENISEKIKQHFLKRLGNRNNFCKDKTVLLQQDKMIFYFIVLIQRFSDRIIFLHIFNSKLFFNVWFFNNNSSIQQRNHTKECLQMQMFRLINRNIFTRLSPFVSLNLLEYVNLISLKRCQFWLQSGSDWL